MPLDPEEANLLGSIFIYQAVKKDAILINRGDIANRAYFVNSGYLRYYTHMSDGSEQTIHLISPGEFGTAFYSYVNNSPSNDILEAVTDAEVLVVDKNALEQVYAANIRSQEFGRRLMESLLLEKEMRLINLLSLTAQERYIKLMETNPGMIQNVPVQFIASYIGIQPESLSRIRKQVFLTNVR
jgi:CRP/FNR family transcriptional regulator, anaerobic regulatory protein